MVSTLKGEILNISKQLLITAGILSFAVALFQIVITFSPIGTIGSLKRTKPNNGERMVA
jgi:hypothetical protein